MKPQRRLGRGLDALMKLAPRTGVRPAQPDGSADAIQAEGVGEDAVPAAPDDPEFLFREVAVDTGPSVLQLSDECAHVTPPVRSVRVAPPAQASAAPTLPDTDPDLDPEASVRGVQQSLFANPSDSTPAEAAPCVEAEEAEGPPVTDVEAEGPPVTDVEAAVDVEEETPDEEAHADEAVPIVDDEPSAPVLPPPVAEVEPVVEPESEPAPGIEDAADVPAVPAADEAVPAPEPAPPELTVPVLEPEDEVADEAPEAEPVAPVRTGNLASLRALVSSLRSRRGAPPDAAEESTIEAEEPGAPSEPVEPAEPVVAAEPEPIPEPAPVEPPVESDAGDQLFVDDVVFDAAVPFFLAGGPVAFSPAPTRTPVGQDAAPEEPARPTDRLAGARETPEAPFVLDDPVLFLDDPVVGLTFDDVDLE